MPSEHLKTLQRRVDFLKSRDHKNSFDLAELGSLEWAIVNLQPERAWVGLTDEEVWECYSGQGSVFYRAIEAKLKEKNT
jgi:hypothetical protein